MDNMVSRNYGIERNMSAPPDEGQGNLRLSEAAPEFTPKLDIQEENKFNYSAYASEWSREKIAEIPSFTPKGAMSASAASFVPFTKSAFSVDATEFRLQPDEEDIVDKGPSFINKVIDEIDTKNSSFSDFEIPCAYAYTVQQIRDIFTEFEAAENHPPPAERLLAISARQQSMIRMQKHNDKKHKDWKPREQREQRERKDTRHETEKWRHEILQEEQKLIEKARIYRERLSKPIEEREKIKRKIKITLNKLSPNNLEKLKVELLQLAKESLDNMDLLAEGIFDKAWAERKYTQMYAQFCGFLSKEFENFRFSEQVTVKNEFKNALLYYVEQCFQNSETINREGLNQEEVQEKVMLLKKKTEGNVKFIGELFNVGLIPIKIILHCVDVLLSAQRGSYEAVDFANYEIDEEKLYGACILLETGAVKLDNPKIVHRTSRIYSFLGNLSQNLQLPNKIRFKIMNLAEERQAGWPKVKVEELKTKEQIRADFEREREERKFIH